MHIHVVVVSTPSPRASFMGDGKSGESERTQPAAWNALTDTRRQRLSDNIGRASGEKCACTCTGEGERDGWNKGRERKEGILGELVGLRGEFNSFKLYLGKDHYRCFMFSG